MLSTPFMTFFIGVVVIVIFMAIWTYMENTASGTVFSDYIDDKFFNTDRHDRFIRKVARQISSIRLSKKFPFFKMGSGK